MKGRFVMIDGLDGVGKGEIISAIENYEANKGTKLFDLNKWWGVELGKPALHDYNPLLEDIGDAELLISSEPTYCGVGRRIRNEYIKNNGRDYTPMLIANAYALDRYDLYEKTIIPARDVGKHILQSRGFVTSIVYQMLDSQLRGNAVNVDRILSYEGNVLASIPVNSPSLLIIPTVKNVDELFDRLELRDKKDDAIFEKVGFQKELKSTYESKWLKDLFERRGCEVRYLDAGISVESTRKQAVELWQEHIDGTDN
jgi:thymidylate kinase